MRKPRQADPAIEMVLADPTGPLDSPLGHDLWALEQRIRAGDRAGIEARWEFGHRLLQRRGDQKQLPKGLQEAIVAQHEISRSEVLHRVKFAEKYSDREEVSNMLDTYRTWREIVHNALYERRAKKNDSPNAGNVVQTFEMRRMRKALVMRRGRFTETERAELVQLAELIREILESDRAAR
jgi:hypothetical protein